MLKMLRPSTGPKRAPEANWPRVRVRGPPRVSARLPEANRPRGERCDPNRVAEEGPANRLFPILGSPSGTGHPTLTAVGMGSTGPGGRMMLRQRGLRGTGQRGRRVLGQWTVSLVLRLLWELVRDRTPVRKLGPGPVIFGRPFRHQVHRLQPASQSRRTTRTSTRSMASRTNCRMVRGLMTMLTTIDY